MIRIILKMPAEQKFLIKIFLSFLIASAIFLFSPKVIFAQVVINEILPNPTSGNDWVELYNNSDQEVNISNWILDDEGTTTDMLKIPEGTTIGTKGFKSFYVSNRLNKSGDTIYLYLPDKTETIDSYKYTSNPGDDVSFGRFPDGSDTWGSCSPTFETTNNCVVATPTPTPTPSPTPSPSPTPTPKPTSTPRPSPTSTPTKSLTSPSTISPSPTGQILATGISLVLGETKIGSPSLLATETASQMATVEAIPTQEATLSGWRKFFPKILLGFGALAILAMIISAFLIQRRKTI
ncbi:lamin tail domain-containing protein [Candidatus Gottesmanbacteria bacterium]|nr:lamin tail domain-containing protein [Candidatus Gottesmanbacteria bacterium]